MFLWIMGSVRHLGSGNMDSIGDRDRGSVGHGGVRNGSNRMFQPCASCIPAVSSLLSSLLCSPREGRKKEGRVCTCVCVYVCVRELFSMCMYVSI